MPSVLTSLSFLRPNILCEPNTTYLFVSCFVMLPNSWLNDLCARLVVPQLFTTNVISGLFQDTVCVNMRLTEGKFHHLLLIRKNPTEWFRRKQGENNHHVRKYIMWENMKHLARGHSMSDHPMKNTLPSQNFFNISRKSNTQKYLSK